MTERQNDRKTENGNTERQKDRETERQKDEAGLRLIQIKLQ